MSTKFWFKIYHSSDLSAVLTYSFWYFYFCRYVSRNQKRHVYVFDQEIPLSSKVLFSHFVSRQPFIKGFERSASFDFRLSPIPSCDMFKNVITVVIFCKVGRGSPFGRFRTATWTQYALIKAKFVPKLDCHEKLIYLFCSIVQGLTFNEINTFELNWIKHY